MRLRLLFAVFIVIAAACNDSGAESTTDVAIDTMELNKFLALFKELNVDSLQIESPDEISEPSDNIFKGVAIDSNYYKFIATDDVSWVKSAGYNYYACFKKSLNDSTIMLVMRTPSEYWESSVKIYLLNTRTQKTFDKYEAAESWGDAGDVMIKTSWLIRNNADYKLITFKNTCWALDYDLDSTECSDSTFYLSIINNKILEEKKEETDTNGIYKSLVSKDRV
jgi:hypothetical protein